MGQGLAEEEWVSRYLSLSEEDRRILAQEIKAIRRSKKFKEYYLPSIRQLYERMANVSSDVAIDDLRGITLELGREDLSALFRHPQPRKPKKKKNEGNTTAGCFAIILFIILLITLFNI
jgi:hypothetical protein